MDVKPIGQSMEKFVRIGSAAGPDYKIGVETTKKNQAESAIAAAPNYEAGVTAAIGRGAFQKGLRESGHGKWRAKSSGKGVRNYGPGMREAGPDWQKGFAPYQSALEGITLPPRGPRGAPGNIERVRIGNERLHEIRIAGG